MKPNRFYSQHGEDVIAWKLFGDGRGPRFFVEVGCVDGLRFSNTLALEEAGWRGVCVEPHPSYVDLVRRNRQGSTVFHAAAADHAGTIPFHADPRGDLSTLRPRNDEEMRRRFGGWFEGFRVVDVPVRTLDDMLVQAGAPARIEVVSIDVEGAELAVLGGFDLERWRPRMLILEADDDEARAALDAHLVPRGYALARRVGINAIYTRSRLDALRARLVRVDTKVFHPPHPFDRRCPAEEVWPWSYETRGAYARRLVRSFARAA